MTLPQKIVLISGSPRRKALLRAAQFQVEVQRPDVDETMPDGPVEDAILAVAERKLDSVGVEDDLCLAADTAVLFGGKILGKPQDRADAQRMLEALSGRDHRVVTGFVLGRGEQRHRQAVSTRVRFRELRREEIEAYVATGEADDKAGSYGIQGLGGSLVDFVEGSYTNVIGLPLREVIEAVQETTE